MSKLPKFLLIPAIPAPEELSKEKGVLIETLKMLFDDIKEVSENYKKAQSYLEMLAAELDPNDENSSFGNMMIELNSIVSSVFPNTALHAKAILNGAHALKPSFEVEIASNIKTSIEYQETGMIRSAVFWAPKIS